jgi:transketolase
VAKLLPQVVEWDGPVYFRLNRNEVPVLFDDSYSPEIGKALTLKDGADVTLIGNGLMVSHCLEAAGRLETGDGLSVRVMEIHTVKPLDTEAVLEAAGETGALVTAEEATVVGGLGAAVAEAVCEGLPVPVVRVGLPDTFAETGPYADILDRYGMSVEHIIAAARRAVSLKNKVPA